MTKVQNVLMLAHTLWATLEQEVLDDVIMPGHTNATHVCLRHNPAGVN